jgi:hypothetical protein
MAYSKEEINAFTLRNHVHLGDRFTLSVNQHGTLAILGGGLDADTCEMCLEYMTSEDMRELANFLLKSADVLDAL